MNKQSLITILKGLLKSDADLSFLEKLEKKELELLIACVRDRVEVK